MKYCPDYSSRFRILKGGKISLVVSALLGSVTLSFAAPSGGVVTSGTATINQSGKITNITQSTQKASINWQKFSIATDETVNFNQPNVNAITLNRVVGNERSIIDGALNANGQVWILNSNGVLFGKNASINTAGLLATTKELSDQEFQAGNYHFKGNSTESVINLGEIDITNSGYATLLANTVSNEGVIKAIKGKVHLVGANEATINLNGNSIVDLTVNKGVLDALVENKGAVYADGGEIYLTTNAVDELLKGVVNNTGVIEAKSLDDTMGKIVLFAHGGTGEFGGSLSTGKGEGFIETSGKVFVNDASLHVETGEWLIDPVNITIDTALAGTISSALGSGGVTVTTDGACTGVTCNGTGTDGDIFVNAGITWSSGNALTLHAYRNILVNAPINASNANGRLVLEYGQGAVALNNSAYYLINAPISLQASGAANGVNGAPTNFSTKLGSDGTAVNYTTIASNDGAALNIQLRDNLGGNFALSTNIALSGTNNWTPTGTFTGRFEGLGHTVSNLHINDNTKDYVGLFGSTNNASIQNIGLVNATIYGKNFVGGLAGNVDNTNILNAHATGNINGARHVGGLIGLSTGNFGWLFQISNSYFSGNVSGSEFNVGGLIGVVSHPTITNSYATGTVEGSGRVGGLVGYINGSATISNSYAKSHVTYQGGYANSAGGLVGESQSAGKIIDSYASGTVTSTPIQGGLIGNNQGATVTDSYYDKDTNVIATNDSDFGRTKADLLALVTGGTWNNTTIWGTQGSQAKGYTTDAITLPFLLSVTKFDNTLFAGGMGINGDPYTITNWTQLQNINYASDTSLLGKYYTLSNNIGSSTADYAALASATANGNAGFVPIGTQANQFNGTFDGLGHTITDLFIYRPGASQIGLFGNTNGATIRNIGIVNTNITGGHLTTGGLVGTARSGTTINNAYATGSVTGTSIVGGLVGGTNGSTITNSYAKVDVMGSGNEVGGLVGGAYNSSTIANSYATGSVTGVTYVGGLVGMLYQSSTITNSYATGSVTGTTLAGGLVGGAEFGTVATNSYWDTQTSGKTTSVRGVGKTTEDMMNSSTYAGWDTDIWTFVDGSTIAGYALGGLPYLTNVTRAQDIVASSEKLFEGGFGTDANPYTITNWTQLQNINYASDTTLLSKYYTLSNNIDSSTTGYTNSGEGWSPIGNSTNNFTGNFNGSNHTIADLVINRPSTDFVGLFGFTHTGATIQNVGVVNANIIGRDLVGGLVGRVNHDTTIANSYTSGSVTGAGSVGGLVGGSYYNTSSITNSYSTASVAGTSTVGGLVGGTSQSTITNSYAAGSVTGASNVGGLVGWSDGVITNSFWDVDTSTIGNSGDNNFGATGKTTTQMINPSTYTGWDTGIWSFTATTSNNAASGYGVSGKLPYLESVTRGEDIITKSGTLFQGGFGNEGKPYTITNWTQLQNINYNSDVLTNGYYFALSNNIDSSTAGYTNSGAGWLPIGNDTNKFNGNFNGVNHTVDNLIINSTSGEQGLFGVVGTGGTIQNIGVTNVAITSALDSIGGLVGKNDGTISNAYVTGDVSGRSNIGGLTGSNSGSITTSYATGSVIGSGYSTGGLVGDNQNGTIANSYASVSVDGTAGISQVGGLVGNLYHGSITNSYATGSVKGNYRVGGLVGIAISSTIENTYASGSVVGTTADHIGGLVGDATSPTIINSFWNTQTSGQTTSAGGTGKTTAQMKESATFTAWDILLDNTIDPNYPTLRMADSGKIWVIGTKSGTTTATPKPELTSENKEIQKVITTIVNKKAITPTLPKVQTETTTPNNTGKNVAINFTVGGNQMLISQPFEGQNTQRISLSEARQMQLENGMSSQEVRVPLSRSSQIVLIDGGVNLPTGIEQEFYVSDDSYN